MLTLSNESCIQLLGQCETRQGKLHALSLFESDGHVFDKVLQQFQSG